MPLARNVVRWNRVLTGAMRRCAPAVAAAMLAGCGLLRPDAPPGSNNGGGTAGLIAAGTPPARPSAPVEAAAAVRSGRAAASVDNAAAGPKAGLREEPGPGPAADPPAPGPDRSQDRGYATYLTAEYKVRPDLAGHIIRAAADEGTRFGFDPVLLLAIMAVESGYNPRAFNGRDVGLMQVNPRSHPEKIAHIGGRKALFDVDKNIHVGAWVLREYCDRTGTVTEALLRYSGSRRNGRAYLSRLESKRLALERFAAASAAMTSAVAAAGVEARTDPRPASPPPLAVRGSD